MEKPRYSTSKAALWLSSACAWLVIFVLAAGAAIFKSEQAVAFGNITVPSMVGLILGILGIHRIGGSFDMRNALKYARDQPASGSSNNAATDGTASP
ncbi:hypothetical protein SAMN05421890_1548 [Ensifer adhaerens]|nr:hypothetical protein SAMN05421890_1548 [Ensifer adhaerens]